jgi:hypothetical protein
MCNANQGIMAACNLSVWCEGELPVPALMDIILPSAHALYSFQIAEKILNKKELEFYKWEGTLSELLQDVRTKLNQVASVSLRALVLCS